MASIKFPVVKCTIRGPKPPPTQNQWNFYAQIRCEGPTGEVLFLIYIRPDRLNLDETINGKPALVNSYDPVSKQGVAYFPAWNYTWHKAMFGRKNVYAQVDDIYPYGNRVFTDVTKSLMSLDPVPDVVAWLKQHPNVDNALTWLDFSYNKNKYGDWPMQKQQDFRAAFAAAWNHQPWPLDDPPPNLAHFDEYYSTAFDEGHAWRLFCALAAYSLAVEIGGRVPWSITGYRDSDLQLLLGSYNILWWIASLKAYQLDIYAVPAPPELSWAFLNSWNLIGKDRINTIARVLDWCRNSLEHMMVIQKTTLVETEAVMMLAHWGYLGMAPVSRIIQGTIRDGAPEWGVRHFTAGCECTSAFLQSVLRTVNIPVEICQIGDGHQTPHFTIEDLYLSHGDDPYDSLTFYTPPFDIKLLLIDSTTFNNWFGPGVPLQTTYDNVNRRPYELGVQYLSDTLLHAYYCDKLLGYSPQNGFVYQYLESFYPDFNTLFPDLWLRMDEKLKKFGALGAPELLAPAPSFPTPPHHGPTWSPAPHGPTPPPDRRLPGPIPPPGPSREFNRHTRSRLPRSR